MFLAVRRGLVLRELSNTIDRNLPQGMLERNDWHNGRRALKLHIGINICAKQAFKTLNQEDLQQTIHLHSYPELERNFFSTESHPETLAPKICHL